MAAPGPNPFHIPGSASGSAAAAGPSSNAPKKKKTHRGKKGKKKKDRRMSFAVPADEMTQDEAATTAVDPHAQTFYNQGSNPSGTSLDSEALLDHRYVLSSGGRAAPRDFN